MTRIATRDGVAYDIHDSGRGPALVMLHGFASSSRTWDGVAHRLGAGRRLLAIDLLGHGGSDAAPPHRHAIEGQAADIAWLIDGLADGSADVIGYSFGARVALRLVIDRPSVVARLVLESPSAGITDAAGRAARVTSDEHWAALLDGGDMAAFHDAWEAQPVFASRAGLSAAVRTAIRDEHLAASGRGLAASLRGAGQGVMAPLDDDLRHVHRPTLVVAGEGDTVGLNRARTIAELIPQSRLEVIERAGHAPHLERPETFVQATTDFLTSQGAA